MPPAGEIRREAVAEWPHECRPVDGLVAFTFFAAYVLILVLLLLVWAGVIGLAMGVSVLAVAALVALAVGALGGLPGS